MDPASAWLGGAAIFNFSGQDGVVSRMTCLDGTRVIAAAQCDGTGGMQPSLWN